MISYIYRLYLHSIHIVIHMYCICTVHKLPVLVSLEPLSQRATHCNTLQHTFQSWCRYSPYVNVQPTAKHAATHCNKLLFTATYCNTLQLTYRGVWNPYANVQHIATHCITLQHTATHCNTLQHIASRCNTLHATHCNTLQHTATHCNTLQHTFQSRCRWSRYVKVKACQAMSRLLSFLRYLNESRHIQMRHLI